MVKPTPNEVQLFLRVFNELVQRVYATPMEDRCEVVDRYTREMLIPSNSDARKRIANTALRIVAFAETWGAQVRKDPGA